MRNVPIVAIPNQEITLNTNGVRWLLRIKQAKHSMCVDVIRNDVELILGVRICVGTPIIPYSYLSTMGNFILVVENEDLPDWQKFGITQQLLFVAPEEYANA